MTFWDALSGLATGPFLLLFFALFVAFAFEFINGFHDTANAVTTVIYTRSLPPTPAVIYSGFMNFLGVLLGGTAVAYGIVNLLAGRFARRFAIRRGARDGAFAPDRRRDVEPRERGTSVLPVSSSHTLIGSILGVGIANSLWNGAGLSGVNWNECRKVGLALLLSPMVGFVRSAPAPALPEVDLSQPETVRAARG